MKHVLSNNMMSIGLIGTFDVDNFGDCVFPDVYIWALSKRFPNCSFTLYSPSNYASHLLTFKSVKALPDNHSYVKFDEECLIVTGGETLSVGHDSGTYIFPLNTLSAYLRIWLAPILTATKFKTRVFIYSVGMAPNVVLAENIISRLLTSADYVRLRDFTSNARLGNAFGVAVDPVFMISNMLKNEEWSERFTKAMPNLSGKRFIIFQFSQSYVSNSLNSWCESVIDTLDNFDGEVLFLPICHMLNDFELLSLAKSMIEDMRPDLIGRMCICEQKLEVLDTVSIFCCCHGYIGTSLHGAVTSISFGKRLAVFSNDLKGKHNETLLAAGISGVVTDDISKLFEVFERGQDLDFESRRANAIERSENDFHALCVEIVSDKTKRRALDESALHEILETDKRAARPLKITIKRFVFKMMRRIPWIWSYYEKVKFKKRFMRV